LGKITCAVGSVILNGQKASQDRFLSQIKMEHVIRLQFIMIVITKICSSPPNQLYFKDAGYDINSCYNVETPNKYYYKCCQFRHSPVYMVPNIT